MLLSDLITRYLRRAELNGLRDLGHIRSRCQRILETAGNVDADTLSGLVFDDLTAELKASGLANSTINKYLATANQLLKFGAYLGACNPPAVLRLKEQKPTARQEVTVKACRAIFERLEDSPHRDLLEMLRWTGRRYSEVAELTWSQRREGGLYWSRSKSGHELATPITEPVQEILSRRMGSRSLQSELVFHLDGQELCYQTVRRRFRRACQALGLPSYTIHDLRATFVTALRRAGVPEWEAMAATGHKTRTAFERYQQVNAEDHRRAVEAAVREMRA